ncbi:Peroxisome biogenesis 3-2-like protein [Melia azedarach]|uniref:Peroxisome biogenesis 3-2-like protein n=1 Tax=Melia azedarach TaxID=155640 RepID=A0ACC1XQ53_MELAZ|nr:Peroxisome biogenesis 3-2-like protein [Melia azedarach]
MLSLRDLWRRHRRKIFVTAGILGGGYFLYKLYDAQQRVADLERQQRQHDELVKAQMQAHFEEVQKIADATTLPHAIHYLSTQIAEQLDLSPLTEKLMRGKEQPNTLSSSERLELWDRLKILSFTKMVVSLWTVTVLSLYIRVQVNILGRHLYIDTARGLGSSDYPEDADLIDRNDQQQFLASVDFLAIYSVHAVISNVQAAAVEVLKGKQLRDLFNTVVLHETVMQMLEVFMGMDSSHQWVNFLMPADITFYKLATASNHDNASVSDVTKFDQLMAETRAVLMSAEYRNVVEISLKAAVDALVDETGVQSGGSLTSGMPLAKLVPRLVQMSPSLLNEPSKNRIIQAVRSIPEVELFFTLLYANMSTS